MQTLWLVEVHKDDCKYDCFMSGVVWADTAEEAERLIRQDRASDTADGLPRGEETRLIVGPAPTEGVAHVHWIAG